MNHPPRTIQRRVAAPVRGSARRGNTIVLVTGILVLLVIIATAYVTRTQAGRITAVSYQAHGYRTNNQQIIADQLAEEIAQALFVREATGAQSNDPRKLVKLDAIRFGSDPNFKPNAVPYHVVPWTNWPDAELIINVNGIDVNFGGQLLNSLQYPLWPQGDGNPNGGGIAGTPAAAYLQGEDNPFGNPGFNDTRWLRDLEPLRWDTWNIFSCNFVQGSVPPDGIPDAFSHWRHMTNIARPDNAWRVVRNINDIDGPGSQLLTDLTIPVEQWLTMRPDISRYGSTGDPIFPGQVQFEYEWCRWFGADTACQLPDLTAGRLINHAAVMVDPFNVPHNFYRVADLNGNGIKHEIGERPQDEFTRDTPRWNVGRVLADTDGDGYTDSFWFLAPTSGMGGIRQIMAVSIIDNGGMLNAAVANRFMRDDAGNPAGVKKTAGLHPGDLALVGQLSTADSGTGGHWGTWNVGFFDNPDHHYLVPYNCEPDAGAIPPLGGLSFYHFDFDASLSNTPATNPQQWQRFMLELGFYATGANAVPTFLTQRHPLQASRLDYWRRSASRMLTGEVQYPPGPTSVPPAATPFPGFQPFTTSDELELRMYHGQNLPWIFSRFESAVQDLFAGSEGRFLRSGLNREESNEYVDQLPNRKLLIDPRRKLTLFNGTRNDIMPPWTWVFAAPSFDRDGNDVINMLDLPDLDGDGFPAGNASNTDPKDRYIFEQGRLKFDLRLPPLTELLLPSGATGAGSVPQIARINYSVTAPPTNYGAPDEVDYNRKVGLALRDRLEVCLTDFQPNLPPSGFRGTYYGADLVADPAAPNLLKTRELAAAYAANIVQWRDKDEDAAGNLAHHSRLAEAVPVRNAPALTTHFMGMEPQPFLLEAFIGHVYEAVKIGAGANEIPLLDEMGNPYTNPGDNIVLHATGVSGIIDAPHTVVVVQIANPYNVPIDLKDYKIVVCGQELEIAKSVVRDHLTGTVTALQSAPNAPIWLAPATDEKPTTAIFYSIDNELIGSNPSDLKWLNFLDLEKRTGFENHPNDTIIASAEYITGERKWDDDRDDYDTYSGDETISLRRLEPFADPNLATSWVIVDRIDPPGLDRLFGNAVNQLINHKPEEEPNPINPEAFDSPYPAGLDIGPATLGYNHWVQWVRATRAWGADMNRNGFTEIRDGATVHRVRYDPNERNPRFVFSDRAVVKPLGASADPNQDDTIPLSLDGRTYLAHGNRYKFNADADAERDPNTSQPFVPARPWFTRKYRIVSQELNPTVLDVEVPTLPSGSSADPAPRKPTFFDMNRGFNDAVYSEPVSTDPYFPYGSSYPDKGWYSQGNSVDDPVIDTGTGELNVRLRFPMQMLQKDDDFEQVGELLNVWLYGHRVNLTVLYDASGNVTAVTYNGTEKTFSEYLKDEIDDMEAGGSDDLYGALARVNRLRLEPTKMGSGNDWAGLVIGIGSDDYTNPSVFTDPRHAVPQLPAGVRVLDAFVCDGVGLYPRDLNGDLAVTLLDAPANAKGFDGTSTPAMINVNTATPEVTRALPHWYRLVHQSGQRRLPGNFDPSNPPVGPQNLQYVEDGTVLGNSALQPLVTNGADAAALLPRPLISESVVHYRERFTGDVDSTTPTPYTGYGLGPNYAANKRREWTAAGPDQRVRGDRGIASIGELLLLNKDGQAGAFTGDPYLDRPTAGATFDRLFDQYWRADLGIVPDYSASSTTNFVPFLGDYGGSAGDFQAPMSISTDRTIAYDPFNSNILNNVLVTRPDQVAGDVEEANALFAGASNIITTRSDVFTVYFRIRSFRQNTSVAPPVWDATNPEYIVDDSRYVMLVDRSNVNKPGDKPRILYLEKLPH